MEIQRKIPSTMATQHPDNSCVPYWRLEDPNPNNKTAFITTQDEPDECYRTFSELEIDEHKWDWEGKFVDEAVFDRLFRVHEEYFRQNSIGKDKFLTYRLPNPKVEKYRVRRALTGISSAAEMAEEYGFHSPPVFEVILPMTESAEEIMNISTAYDKFMHLDHPLFRFENGIENRLEVIPLFEQVSTIGRSHKILEEYILMYQDYYKTKPIYIRPYIARSDPALNSGIVPTVAIEKVANSRYRRFEERFGIPLFPILGCAALPFRGGLTPLNVEDFILEYPGINTVTLQGAYRYDYPKHQVIEGNRKLNKLLPKNQKPIIDEEEEEIIESLLIFFEQPYKETIEAIPEVINNVAKFIPSRRERVQHIGLFGYSRGGLPRAIPFTGSLYSLGIPPEMIGTGRGLQKVKEMGMLDYIEKFCKNLKQDLVRSGTFFNRENLNELAKKSNAWDGVQSDVRAIEKYLQFEFIPLTSEDKEYHNLTTNIFKRLDLGGLPIGNLVEEAAKMRKSIG
ncbi:MAG: phosphoenolpyruvate carboxylase [Candidatus Daviesbacteria bacterium]